MTISGKIVTLQDGKNGNIFPETTAVAVYMSNGKTLEETLKDGVVSGGGTGSCSITYEETSESVIMNNPDMVQKVYDIESGLAGKVDSSNIVNDLNTGGIDKVLSAEQGKVLKSLIGQASGATPVVVINDLTTGGATDALSAEQGKILKGSIDTINSTVSNKIDKSKIVNDLVTGGADNVLSAEQGKVISTLKSEVDKMKDSITNNKPIVITNDTPVGSIVFVDKSSTEIEGWLVCNGSLLNTVDYPDLFQVIGYTHGGSDTQFAIPNIVLDNLVIESIDNEQTTIDAKIVKNQVAIIKAKKIDDNMISVAQEWTTFKENGGNINGNISVKKENDAYIFAERTNGQRVGMHVYEDGVRGFAGALHLFNESGSHINGLIMYADGLVVANDKPLTALNDKKTNQELDNVGYTDTIFMGCHEDRLPTDSTKDGMVLNLGEPSGNFMTQLYHTWGGELMQRTKQSGTWGDWSLMYSPSCSKNHIGFTKLPNGLILQWGTVSDHIDGVVNFPVVFPNAMLSINANVINSADNWGGDVHIQYVNNGSIRLVVLDRPSKTYDVKWTAIGY